MASVASALHAISRSNSQIMLEREEGEPAKGIRENPLG